ncbi:unnamed protein product [Symbiodinium sp. CCMP2592]|nr:unnamed protein product [Symbiodinium sp. CCMP2592]
MQYNWKVRSLELLPMSLRSEVAAVAGMADADASLAAVPALSTARVPSIGISKVFAPCQARVPALGGPRSLVGPRRALKSPKDSPKEGISFCVASCCCTVASYGSAGAVGAEMELRAQAWDIQA